MQSLTTPDTSATQIAPQRTRTLTVEDIPIALIDQGSGPPTLFLHGIFDSADTWQGVIARVNGLRCLVPDLPGFGLSGSVPNFDGKLPHLAQFIEHLLAAAGINEPINLVAYDIGATYGLAWAVTHPAQVRRLAILNSNFFSDYTWHGWARVWRTPIIGDAIMATVNETLFARTLMQAAPTISPDQARAAAGLVTPQAKRMALRHYRALDSVGFRGWEERLLALTAQVPTLVCWGDRDQFIAPTFAERFGAQEVHHFTDCGHWLPLEAPEELAERLNAFLLRGGV